MMKVLKVFILLSGILGLLPAGNALAETKKGTEPVELQTVGNFGLHDQQGNFHELYYYEQDAETKAVVLFVQGNGCPLVRKRIPELNRLQKTYGARGVRFWMLNANSQDSREDVIEEANEFGMTMPILMDTTQLVAQSLDIQRTAEVLVIEPGSWKIVYRGSISDRLDYEAAKPEATREYLVEALDQLLAGKPVTLASTKSPGCRISYLTSSEQLSSKEGSHFYSKTIAPLLVRNCVHCHTKGGIAPWSMSGYRKVRGWAEMMEEVVMTGRMPPWQADPHIGAFSNDFSLSEEEKLQLVQWIRTGAPRGQGPDPLADYKPVFKEWALGTPDKIIEIEEQSVPAEGIIDYRYITIDSPFEADVWVRAVDVRPGNTRVLHHVIAKSFFLENGEKKHQRGLAGYAPGMGPDLFPEGTAILLPAKAKIEFQLHYTVSGKPETDRTRLGLYLLDSKPEKVLRGGLLIETKFQIPPGDRAFTITKSKEIKEDILLYSMNPHMHFRGKSMSYEVRYPDGRLEMLLSVPNYHFNWQRSYKLAEPKFLPKGATLTVKATWDNSPLNAYNPDPERTVGWGEQSFDEMFFATYKFVRADPPQPSSTASVRVP